MKLLVTGGCGFIGSAVVHRAIKLGWSVVNVDKLTYAGNLGSVAAAAQSGRYAFEQADIRHAVAMKRIFRLHDPDAVMHLAAETHVDRSIDAPRRFVETNVLGTCILLQAALRHFGALAPQRREKFRFMHISTDEVYGALGVEGRFSESTPYAPRSPYAASKAGSDHLVRAWGETFGLPILVTNCSNNYGPRQFPEKLIPLVILRAIAGEPIPVYGSGENIRDWLYVDDHAEALTEVLTRGSPGEGYNIGGECEVRNIDLVRLICAILDEMRPAGAPHGRLITMTADRPGHDFRYAIDPGKTRSAFGWRPRHDLETGLRATVRWYLDNETWWSPLMRRGDFGKRRGLRR